MLEEYLAKSSTFLEKAKMINLANGLVLERDTFAYCFTSLDTKEGTAAFLEKRKAIFTGKLDS